MFFYVDLQKLLGLHVLIIGGVVLIILSLWRIDYCREFWRSLKSIVRIYIIYYHDAAIIKIYIIKNYTGSTMLYRILFSSIVVSDTEMTAFLCCVDKSICQKRRDLIGLIKVRWLRQIDRSKVADRRPSKALLGYLGRVVWQDRLVKVPLSSLWFKSSLDGSHSSSRYSLVTLHTCQNGSTKHFISQRDPSTSWQR